MTRPIQNKTKGTRTNAAICYTV